MVASLRLELPPDRAVGALQDSAEEAIVQEGGCWEHGLATTIIERVAQRLGTLPEVEKSCLLAFPMVYFLIAV